MKGQLKKQKRLDRQIELLKNFEGDFYQEKHIGEEWYIKSWNGGTERWQVSIFSDYSYQKYKRYGAFKKENEEDEEEIKNKLEGNTDWEKPTIESIRKIVEQRESKSKIT